MKTNTAALSSIIRVALIGLFSLLNSVVTLHADPQLTSWFTTYNGRYARIFTNSTMQANGTSLLTWSNSSLSQSLPAYSGIQEIDYSADWIYLRSTGLGIHVMGPWSTGFPNLPTNQKIYYRIPRTSTLTTPTNKTLNGGGSIGYFVDGVSMFNSWDAYYWSGTADTGGGNTGGYWNRDAYVNEGATFDPAYAHQQNTGTYHYHADPIALRYLLGDHVTYNSSAKTWSESTAAVTNHSPLLGWVADGYPSIVLGYSNPTNPASGVRRMVSGYVPRNGQNGSDNISTTGSARTYLPTWALRGSTNMTLNGTTNGPAVSSSYPFGRYMEDNAYLGDLTNSATGSNYVLGVDFDLNEYNCRYCVTPEFPGGTYAYFVSISSSSSNAVPTFPYNIGHAFYGNPTGVSVTTLTETVTTNYLGGPNANSEIATPAVTNSTVSLVWSAVEGGTYQVQSTTNFTSWSTNTSGIAPNTNLTPIAITGSWSGSSSASNKFFRVARTALATYDPVTSSGYGITSVSPTNGNPGATFTLTINLNPSVSPPPQMAPINSIMLGTITGSNYVHVSSNQVTSSITIPGNASPSTPTVTVVFPGPPGDTSNVVTYSLTSGFTIN